MKQEFDSNQEQEQGRRENEERKAPDGGLNREDSGAGKNQERRYGRKEGERGTSPYLRDKRPRINRTTATQARSDREAKPWASRRNDDREGAGERRHSFNPNFDRDNRRRDGGYGNPERDSRSGYPRENRYPKENRFNRDDRPNRYGRDDRGNRYPERPRENGEEPNFNRHPDYQQRDGYSRGDRNGGYNRENRGPGRGGRYAGKPGERQGNGYGRDNRYGSRPGRPEADRYGDRKKGRKKPGRSFPAGGYDSEYKPVAYPAYTAPAIEEPIRLNRYISMSGLCSRREADEYIKEGGITVNGQVVTELGVKVNPGDEIRYKGERLEGEKKVYILMNKPKGFVTTVEDPNADRTVMEIVKNACNERIYPVGRLDKNSLGVLLITNDGELTKKLTHPSHEKKKVYQVSLDRAISLDELQQLCDGIELEDGTIAADEASFVNASKKEIGIVIHSGRNRIIRRMFEHLGYHVLKLDRVYFAGLTKKGLRRGAWRYLTPKEVAMLKAGAYE